MLLLVAGCVDQPPPPTAEDYVGVWCGPDRDVLTLDPARTFTATDVSTQLVDEVLHDEAYVVGYRRQTDYNGVTPERGAGRWHVFVDRGDMFQARREHVVLNWSTFDATGVDEELELTVAGNGDELVLGVERIDPDFTILFVRCPAGRPGRDAGPTG
ncbi:hypothetical protein ACVCAH_10900 [Micromonospora sp. LZ34]